MREIGVGLLGLGVVGSEVANVLLQRSARLSEQVGAAVALRRVLVRDVTKARPYPLPSGLLVSDPEAVLSAPDIDIVVELIGGEDPAHDYMRRAISNGKHVVTANKEVIAKNGFRLLSLASQHRVDLRYEASVASGIPILSPLQQDLAANEIGAIRAIVNGTTNFILTKMAKEGIAYGDALRQAQQLGYAEANPANDVEGIDAAYKLAILASLAFHTPVKPSAIYRQGISTLHPRDFTYAHELGFAVKLLAIAKERGTTIEARVHPALVPLDSQLATVDGVYNAIQIEGDLVGTLVFYGRGAGGRPTSSTVVADVLTIARNIAMGGIIRPRMELNRRVAVMPMSDVETRYYFRLSVGDQPGVLAQIASVLGDQRISISAVIQKELDPVAQTAVIVILTHPSIEKAVQTAVAQLAALPSIKQVGALIRVEQ
ncbi:MAG: homoserine dehydrogenase [Dehalococcoidia bacterium]|jgi:homoserine dehydrogenase|nr:homoserine dehydrogenase [Dehalococcoidia bacterium]